MVIHGHWSDFYSPGDLGIEPDENETPDEEEKARCEAWERIAAYIKKQGYDWTYEHLEHDYLSYYLNGAFCSYTCMDIIKNNEEDCRKAFV